MCVLHCLPHSSTGSSLFLAVQNSTVAMCCFLLLYLSTFSPTPDYQHPGFVLAFLGLVRAQVSLITWRCIAGDMSLVDPTSCWCLWIHGHFFFFFIIFFPVPSILALTHVIWGGGGGRVSWWWAECPPWHL